MWPIDEKIKVSSSEYSNFDLELKIITADSPNNRMTIFVRNLQYIAYQKIIASTRSRQDRDQQFMVKMTKKSSLKLKQYTDIWVQYQG